MSFESLSHYGVLYHFSPLDSTFEGEKINVCHRSNTKSYLGCWSFPVYHSLAQKGSNFCNPQIYRCFCIVKVHKSTIVGDFQLFSKKKRTKPTKNNLFHSLFIMVMRNFFKRISFKLITFEVLTIDLHYTVSYRPLLADPAIP